MNQPQTISCNPADLSVAIGFPCGPSVPWQTSMSLAKTVKACTERRIPIDVCCVAGSSVVTWARNKVLDSFLSTGFRRLFWIDSDIVWEPDDFIRLLAASTAYDVVSAVYAQKNDRQTIVLRREDLRTFHVSPHGLIRFDGCGLGFTVMRREIVEHVASVKPKVYDPVDQKLIADVFRTDTVDRGHEAPDIRHEDIAHFADLAELGYEIWLDPTRQLGHVGPREYRADPMKALRLDYLFDGNSSITEHAAEVA